MIYHIKITTTFDGHFVAQGGLSPEHVKVAKTLEEAIMAAATLATGREFEGLKVVGE